MLAALAALLATVPAARAQPHPAETSLLLAVVVNGTPRNMIGDFEERGGLLYAAASELETLGFRLAAGAPAPARDVPLTALVGVTYRFDRPSQTIYFTAVSAALEPTLVNLQAIAAAQKLPVRSGTGVVINYDLTGTSAGRFAAAEGLLDTRVFSPWGIVSSAFVATTAEQAGSPALLRLDTTYTYSDPDTLRRYRAGDIITSGLDWSRPVRLGGLQITTDFSIRPDLVTFPVPTIGGAVAVPSSVDVLVNGVQLLSRDLPPGPFEVRELPVVTGEGDVVVVTRNEIGQQVAQTLPVYVSTALLTPGRTAFSGELGALRLQYGFSSDTYTVPASSFSIRYGLLKWLTLQGHAEGNAAGTDAAGVRTAGGGTVGGGAAFTVARVGLVSLAASGSNVAGRSGGLASVSYERIARMLSLAASFQVTTQRYGDIAAASGQPVPRLRLRASVGLALPRIGSLGIAYVGIRQLASQVSGQGSFYGLDAGAPGSGFNALQLAPATRVDLLSASFSRQIFHNRASIYASAFHDFAQAGSAGVALGITIPIGRRSSAGINLNKDGGSSTATFVASQAANEVGQVGWEVQDDAGRPDRQLAQATYKSSMGVIEAGLDRIAGQVAWRGSAQGAVAYAGGGTFAGNTISDSFAVVDTEGTAGVQVLQENRLVGRTGTAGLLLVPDLRSFGVNRLAIDPTDIAMDAEIGPTMQLVRPQDRSGIVVHFPVRQTHGAILQLVDADGAAIPVGSSARLDGRQAAIPVGYDGEAFVTGLALHNRLTVRLAKGQQCLAAFDYHAIAGTLPRIGPVACRATAP